MSFPISLAQWSLHRTLFSKQLDNLDFPVVAKQRFGIDAVEYVNQFFIDKAEDAKYQNELLKRCRDNGVRNHLIMVDNEGMLAASDKYKRKEALEHHYKWINAASYLGCTIVRVNAFGDGSPEDIKSAATESLQQLGEYASKEGIDIVVENHGGITSNGAWLASLMQQVNKKNVGMLPDLGNFCLKYNDSGCEEEYDRYQGVKELMPYAKSISAKTQEFDEQGNCVETDYRRMIQIIKDAGFKGYMGIEYSGTIPEEEGIRKSKALLESVSD